MLTQRIVASSHLNSSPKLCELFLYVVDCCLREAPEEATEQQIGIHVFHRKPGYNTSEDSIVRSQARLLRLKLAAYFAAEGASETLLVEIPKGHYLPVFHEAIVATVDNGTKPLEDPEPISQSSAGGLLLERSSLETAPGNPLQRLLPWICLLLGLMIGLAAAMVYQHVSNAPRRSSLELFWGPFLRDDPPLVIYSNPLFIGRPETGLRIAPPESQSPSATQAGPLDESYTGIGEIAAVHDLTLLFAGYRREFTLKRSRLVTWDEARQRNLIFLGAGSQNGALHDLPTTTDFAFQVDEQHRGFIENRHAEQGEPATFVPSSPNDEYAIVAFIPGMESGRYIAVFAGLNTSGTQAAVEFACQPKNLADLQQRLKASGKELPPFEAVLHITLNRGVPLQTEIVAAHLRSHSN